MKGFLWQRVWLTSIGFTSLQGVMFGLWLIAPWWGTFVASPAWKPILSMGWITESLMGWTWVLAHLAMLWGMFFSHRRIAIGAASVCAGLWAFAATMIVAALPSGTGIPAYALYMAMCCTYIYRKVRGYEE